MAKVQRRPRRTPTRASKKTRVLMSLLKLVFKKADGKQKVLNVTDPRENVTAEEARTAMQSIVDSGVFNADGNALAEVVEARVRTTEVNVLK